MSRPVDSPDMLCPWDDEQYRQAHNTPQELALLDNPLYRFVWLQAVGGLERYLEDLGDQRKDNDVTFDPGHARDIPSWRLKIEYLRFVLTDAFANNPYNQPPFMYVCMVAMALISALGRCILTSHRIIAGKIPIEDVFDNIFLMLSGMVTFTTALFPPRPTVD